MTGVLEVSAADYHADKVADVPTLSASVAKLLVSHSPLHAWTQHPRLNPNYERKTEEKFELGTCVHDVLLEGRERVQVIAAPDWRTKDAKEMRDDARKQGLIPLLTSQWAEVLDMVEAAREHLDAHPADPPLLANGKPEQTLVWEEDGVTCRARLDWIHDDLRCADDYKTAYDANRENWSKRALFNNGYDFQAAFHLRGLKAVTGAVAKWRWVVQEKTPPYALSVITPGADVLAVGESKVQRAIDLWRECIRTGVWPGYPTGVYEAELPAWADDAKWLVPEYRDAA